MPIGNTSAGLSSREEGLIGRSMPDDLWIPNHGRDNGESVGEDGRHFLNLGQHESTCFVILFDYTVAYTSVIC